ncbi:hypothetical protein LSM04_008665 [Trypanosoma melophagium]|uniref:uncharacterized protein n=1 Tax=Trypanosoma melophagium TaxID=715481 RepID=UPI00351A55BA|nr:hypothetical protein LSM04_008665 [Trypanosoma melophagium]
MFLFLSSSSNADKADSLEVQLCATPVTALLIPLNAIACAKANPVRHGLVLIQLLGVLLLNGKWLKASHSFVCNAGSRVVTRM